MCIINKKLLYFGSLYRQYLAKKIFESQEQEFKQVENGNAILLTHSLIEIDLVINVFSQIIDCPDIVAELIPVWHRTIM